MDDNGERALSKRVALTAVSTRMAEVRTLAESLELDVVEAHSSKHDFHLVLSHDRLELTTPRSSPRLNISVEFVTGSFGYRRSHGSVSGQVIARAVGIRGAQRPSVIDATLGLGRDAFLLASLGCNVCGIERSPIVSALVYDGLMRAAADRLLAPVISDHFELVLANAIDYLEHLEESERPEVIYLDPMFPARKKSALVKKEMQVLQKLLGDDTDSVALLDVALRRATRRVVVKRPRHAGPLEGPKPQMQLFGKSVRFDIYPRTTMDDVVKFMEKPKP